LEEPDIQATNLARLQAGPHNATMHEGATYDRRIAPSASTAAAVDALFVVDFEHDAPLVSIPRPETQLVVRFGPAAQRGLDVYAFGARDRAHRKLIRAGQRAVTARLRLGASEAVLGAPAADLAGRIVALADLWGEAETERLRERLASASDAHAAARVLDRAIAERLTLARASRAPAALSLAAADKLASSNVNAVADDLGVSERHLRRLFRDAIGMAPKAFAKLARFHRALHAMRQDGEVSWASVAAAAGYYDQAHLIAEFRAIAGVTPRALLLELRAAPSNA